MSTTVSNNIADIAHGDEGLTMPLLLSAMILVLRIRRRIRWSGRPPCPRRRRPEFWLMTGCLSDTEFEQAFRMSRDKFKELCCILRPHISPRMQGLDVIRERTRHMAGGCIQTEVKVGSFLRIMAGASFLDVQILFRIGRFSVFRVFHIVLMAVLRELPWRSFPRYQDAGGFRDMALAFTLSRPVVNPLPGCIAAVDGLQVQIERPGREYNPLQYFSRKGYFSLPVQAVVDAEYRFVACSVLAVGSTHDNVAFALSDIYAHLHSGEVPNGFWVAGDEAYSCTEGIIIPFANSMCTEMHDAFNFFHSSHRIHLEQAFGILKKRWGILLRPLSFNIQMSTKIIPAAMKLHNFCINMDGGILKPARTTTEIRIAQETLSFWLRWCQTGHDMGEHLYFEQEVMCASASRAEARSETRRKLMIIVRRENLRRPSSSRNN